MIIQHAQTLLFLTIRVEDGEKFNLRAWAREKPFSIWERLPSSRITSSICTFHSYLHAESNPLPYCYYFNTAQRRFNYEAINTYPLAKFGRFG